MRKLLTLLTAALLAVGMLGVAGPVAAADNANLAGKPVNGDGFGTGSTCHGTIYGKVNGRFVLFIPYHCSGGAGHVWYGPSGQRIGVTGPTVSGITNLTTDLSWIIIDAEDHPFGADNLIHIGATNVYNPTKTPSASVSCGNLGFYDTLRVGYWTNSSTAYGPWNGTTVDINTNSTGCDITTTHDNNLGPNNIPSGAPLWDYTDGAFIGDAKAKNSDNRTVFASWRTTMINMQEMYGTDTYFCANSDCS